MGLASQTQAEQEFAKLSAYRVEFLQESRGNLVEISIGMGFHGSGLLRSFNEQEHQWSIDQRAKQSRKH
ncbi:Aromatic_amino acid hydroxylase [Hexamita inflata]|uniref:C-terminal n=1 Tax=Hexamita inflata TaxID=28002 RepID=A0AA86P0Z1_9EUKA|nr:Aromatic amino acid hydroxylase [Hexamita inflata]